MKIYLYFLLASFLLTGCLLTPKDPPNAIRPGDLTPINPVQAVIQLSDISGSFNETRADAFFLEQIPREQQMREGECKIYQDSTREEDKWQLVSAGKVMMGTALGSKLLELKKDEYNRYQLKLNKQVAPGFYQVYVQGSKKDGHILIPGFQILGISMPEVIEGVRLNDESPNPAKVYSLKKGDLKVTWNSQSFPNDYTRFIFQAVAKQNNILTTLQCVTEEPEVNPSRLAWTIPKSYINQLPNSEVAEVNFARVHVRGSEGDKFLVQFKGIRQYTLAAKITE
jgi:hypothetical protein